MVDTIGKRSATPTTSYDGKLTIPLLKVLFAFLDRPGELLIGSQVMKITVSPSGSVYPLLGRLVECGWLSAGWEEMDPLKDRQPRRQYQLTKGGREKALELLRSISSTLVSCYGK